MFNNLVESGSRARELRRTSTFFLGTFILYAVLLSAIGVGSIYAYNAHLDRQELEIIELLRFPPLRPRAEPEPRPAPQPAGGSTRVQRTQRPEVSMIIPVAPTRQVASASTREVRRGTLVDISPFTSDAPPGPVGPPNLNNSSGAGPSGNGRPLVETDDVVPERRPTPRPTPQPTPQRPVQLTSTILSGKAIHKPAPDYPRLARDARVQGPVVVQIVVDEQGRVISADATSGHPLLRQAAVRAALQARFTPTVLGGQPVKVSGMITYNFVLQ